MAAHAYESFIADGFADDCEELTHRCLKKVPVTFKDFSKIFREMKIATLFNGRQSGAEIAELTEEVINIAKFYMVANTGYFEHCINYVEFNHHREQNQYPLFTESVVGLFLVYALLNIQPFEKFARLRLVDGDVPYIDRIERIARRDRRLDVLYVLGKILIEHTYFLASARERGMEPSYRKYLEGCTTAGNLGLRPKGVFLRQNEELDLIKEMSKFHAYYEEAKLHAKADNMPYTDAKLAKDLDTSLTNIINGFIHENEVEEVEQEETMSSIKARAMKAKVNPVKHLLTLEERAAQNPPRPAPTSDIKTQPGKIKTGSRTKKFMTSKTKIKMTPKRQKRMRRSRDSDETTEESDISVVLSDHDSGDIDLANFHKAPPSTEVPKKQEEHMELEVENPNLNLGSLPCVITSEDNGKTYEIEIIDKYKPPINKPGTYATRKELVEIGSNESLLVKRPQEKRDLKKTILMSRFKRMGIEPIANFKPKG